MSELLDRILELQEAQDALNRATQTLNDIPDWMRELHREHAVRKAEIDALEASAEAALEERRAVESQIEEVQAKLKRYQEQINQVTTQREYSALLQEIDASKARVTELEIQGVGTMERREKAQQDLEVRRTDFSDLDQRYAVELGKWEKEKPEVARQVAELTQRIEKLREALPRPWLVQFDRIAQRTGGTAMAPIRLLEGSVAKAPRRWHCGACNFNVRPQVVVGIRTSQSLILCESCKRILFLPASEPAE